MHFPERFHTGLRDRTIPNPAFLHRTQERSEFGPIRRGHAQIYEGKCSEYNFRLQTKNYNALQKVLQRNGADFLYVAAARYMGDRMNHRFVACSTNGSLLWNKYVGYSSQSGQNHVYVAGMRIKVSIFLGLDDNKQDALLSNSKSNIQKAFGQNYNFKYLDESNDIWN